LPELTPEQILATALGVAFGLALARWQARLRMAKSRRIGRRAERRARTLIKRAGFRVVDVQPSATVLVNVDGRDERFLVRGDLLVRKRRRLYLVEIKGGAGGGSVAHRGTRRQLLEYATVFDVHGTLLVDVPGARIQQVTFPELGKSR
jgi:hypothetical protein